MSPNNHDEHRLAGILTSGLDLAPAFPVAKQPVAVGVCSPLQWRNRPRFSRGSRAPACVSNELSKSALFLRRSRAFAKSKVSRKAFAAISSAPGFTRTRLAHIQRVGSIPHPPYRIRPQTRARERDA